MWLAFSDALPWTRAEASAVYKTPLDPFPFPSSSSETLLRTSALHVRAQRAKFTRWLDTPPTPAPAPTA